MTPFGFTKKKINLDRAVEPAGPVFSLNETSDSFPRPAKAGRSEAILDVGESSFFLVSDLYVYASPPSPPRVAALEPLHDDSPTRHPHATTPFRDLS